MEVMKLLFGISFSLLMALVGYKKKAVSKDGAVAGFFVGICSCVFGGYRGASVLFFFFFSSSLLTRFKGKNKKQIEHGHKKGGQRNWVQVFSNGVGGSIFALFFALTSSGTILNVNEPPIDLYDNFWATFYIIGYISHYACCNGDTWASELGVVMGAVQPLLLLGIKDGKVLLLKRVPRGTNGAVSLFGCLASIAGGLLVGIAFELANILLNGFSLSQLCLSLFIGASAGFIGSTVISFCVLLSKFPSIYVIYTD